MNESLILTSRPRRSRKSQAVRDLVAETNLNLSHLVYPVFFADQAAPKRTEIKTLPGLFRFNCDELFFEIEDC